MEEWEHKTIKNYKEIKVYKIIKLTIILIIVIFNFRNNNSKLNFLIKDQKLIQELTAHI